MGDDYGWIERLQRSMTEPGPIATKVATVVRQANAAHVKDRNADAVRQTRAAAADVRFEQMIVDVERFMLVAAIYDLINASWSHLEASARGLVDGSQDRAKTDYDGDLFWLRRIGNEAAGIRQNLLELKNQSDVDSTDKVLLSKMKNVSTEKNDAQRSYESYLKFTGNHQGQSEYFDTYVGDVECILIILRLMRIQRGIIDTPIGNWRLAAAVQTATTLLVSGEVQRAQRIPRLKKLYTDTDHNLDVIKDQYRPIVKQLKDGR